MSDAPAYGPEYSNKPPCVFAATNTASLCAASASATSSRGSVPTRTQLALFRLVLVQTLLDLLKLVVTWHLGRRDGINTQDFITKLRDATAPGRFQVSSDAFPAYRPAIEWGLHDRADYAQIIKLYGVLPTGRESYRPARIKGSIRTPIQGFPNPRRICTSHVERLNNSLRQHCKRFTRLTLAFSKKQENLRAALALHFGFYNFCRVHGSLRVTPAMESGLTDHIWTIGELLAT